MRLSTSSRAHTHHHHAKVILGSHDGDCGLEYGASPLPTRFNFIVRKVLSGQNVGMVRLIISQYGIDLFRFGINHCRGRCLNRLHGVYFLQEGNCSIVDF